MKIFNQISQFHFAVMLVFGIQILLVGCSKRVEWPAPTLSESVTMTDYIGYASDSMKKECSRQSPTNYANGILQEREEIEYSVSAISWFQDYRMLPFQNVIERFDIDTLICWADTGDQVAVLSLTALYYRGGLPSVGEEKIIEYLERASGSGEINCISSDGVNCCVKKFRQKKNPQFSCKCGLPEAQFELARFYYNKNINVGESIILLKRAASSGYGPARRALLCYEKNTDDCILGSISK